MEAEVTFSKLFVNLMRDRVTKELSENALVSKMRVENVPFSIVDYVTNTSR